MKLESRWLYGKLAVFDLSETGRQIGEKISLLLDEKQKKELAQYLLDDFTENIGKMSPHLKHSWQQEHPLTEIRQGDLYVCLEHRLVIVRGQEILLTVKEFDILLLLIMNPKRVFTYELIMELVWNEDYTYYSRKAINNHVSNLRKKLKSEPNDPDYIKSVTGIGYKFALP